jgi:hypothetical protein
MGIPFSVCVEWFLSDYPQRVQDGVGESIKKCRESLSGFVNFALGYP